MAWREKPAKIAMWPDACNLVPRFILPAAIQAPGRKTCPSVSNPPGSSFWADTYFLWAALWKIPKTEYCRSLM